MLTKTKALYQVKLVLDYLPQEEYDLIPKKTIDYILENMEYDESIIINPDIPLENQNIDDKSYRYLKEIISQVETGQTNNLKAETEKNTINANKSDINEGIKAENIRLQNLVEILQKENAKIPKVKDLFQKYKDELEKKSEKIKTLEDNNYYLQSQLDKIPKFIRRIFIKKNDVKLLESRKEGKNES